MITRHARIIDQNNVRHAWGTINGMYKALERIVHNPLSEEVSTREKNETMDLLLKLKKLYDSDVISKEEYERKKNEYMSKL
ncbi:MAG: SHOCT domain-containing protein [Lachnospiraceae bacterium]|nr:SHOCT domain-containing protein [Lachnospiraceae bacterium]